MSSTQADFEKFKRDAAAALHEHWVLFLVEGVVLLVLGATAIALAPLATVAVTILLGWLFLVSGVIGLFTTYWMRHAPGFWWSLVSAVLGIVVGVLLLASPIRGAVSLTVVLSAFFIVEGVVSIMFALDHRRELSGRWGWMMVSGIIDVVLGGMIFAQLPSSAAWAIGLLAGINMIFGGSALIGMALAARKPAA
ncbi:HdeD family acid-resistance protein [Pseudolabrys taiwanensis]|uniref:HdeD family acid-resistance protein n=1 Tax=Pseudolabrys taiwanensis TaxID=331696 RepID=A0A345ZWG6_9HYPH|nr:HdeD family acid-resistance protein [Pseudolabrys taiwanensis]AXK81263.1 HdeD family acid-resistance protein [Pseudolabrys taiwanensis]